MPTDVVQRPAAGGTSDLALLGLLQLVSPALPIGAFAWSQGLEGAIERGWVSDEAALADWLSGVLDDGLSRCELPVLGHLQAAWAAADSAALCDWNDWLLAQRETAELYEEERRLGEALLRLLRGLDLLPCPARGDAALPPEPGYLTVFAWVAHRRRLAPRQAQLGFAWAWLENQLAVACKVMPLGHVAAQRLYEVLRPRLVAAVDAAEGRATAELGALLPGLALVSAQHETQYSRMFRS
ncbi:MULTISPECIES: urease accessory protein UreF [Halomonas]|uniref:Urease accessory protein UreF n=2 Tax=Halomonas TaxID=2745 RepID=A0A7X4W137_9GAMM|nr:MULTISPECIES: urease accessory UreF family protein [Halomonas]MDR5902432.1 urease accessory UreF family protein [Halomonas icarae]NAW12743.1 urease accessory protein UreF [Halomonas icarae]TDB02316.1 urease accessory protein UreF [Halomonas marinisediminis]